MNRQTASTASDLSNRTRLLRAATDAFAEHGYDGASLRAIAHAAGVSFQLIAHYFGTKTELWLATVDYLHERYFETGKGLGFKTSGNIREQFHNHLRLLLTDILQRPQLRKIWVQEYLAGSDRYTNVIKPRIVEFQETVSLPYYEEVVRLGLVKKYTPQEISQLLAGMVLVNVVHSHYLELVTGHEVGSAQSIDAQIDLIFRLLTEAPDEDTAEHAEVVAESRADELGQGHARDETVVYAWDDARGADVPARTQLEQLEAENDRLRDLLTSARLENKVLVDALEQERRTSAAKPQPARDRG